MPEQNQAPEPAKPSGFAIHFTASGVVGTADNQGEQE